MARLSGYKRYPVSGRTLFQAESTISTGELVDISRGGACIRSEVKPREGEEIVVRFTVQDYPEVLEVSGIVLHVQSDSWAVLFLEEIVGLAKLLRYLDERAQKQNDLRTRRTVQDPFFNKLLIGT